MTVILLALGIVAVAAAGFGLAMWLARGADAAVARPVPPPDEILSDPALARLDAAWRSDEAYMNQLMPPASPADQARRFVAMTKARDAQRRARALAGGTR